MKNFFIYREILKSDIVNYLKDQRIQNIENHWQSDLLERLEAQMLSGKIIRGCLVCFSHDAFAGNQKKAAEDVAIALELVHTSLLILDDIIDQDTTRRGHPSLHRQYESLLENGDSGHFGESMAICVADATIFMAYGILGELNIPSSQKTQIMNLFSRSFALVCTGQMLDVEMGHVSSNINKTDILTVMRQKTALYSISLPLVAGAILAGQGSDTIKKLRELGDYIGTIFQIRDDELGIFGDVAKTGKPVGSDIHEGKKTLLYYYLFKSCSTKDKRRLNKIFGNRNATKEDILYVKRLIEKLGIREKLEREITGLSSYSLKIINDLDLAEDCQTGLRDLLEFSSKREK